jgi:hypothetical protein
MLLQKSSVPLGLGRKTPLTVSPRSLVAVRYREESKAETTTRSWRDSPYYSGVGWGGGCNAGRGFIRGCIGMRIRRQLSPAAVIVHWGGEAYMGGGKRVTA